jgi:lipopolysaccharide heptosyltransferase III
MGVPLHSRLRKRLRDAMNKLLALILSNKVRQDRIDPAVLERILIVRVNYRIGNALFMTPLIRALAKTIPNAKIDLLVGTDHAKNVLQPMPQVNRVYTAPRKLLRSPSALLREIRAMNRNRYDAIILPAFGSTTSNAATLLVKAKYKIGFFSPDSWTPVNHAIPFPDDIQHEALRPLQLMHIFDAAAPVERTRLDIELSADEQRRGCESLAKILRDHSIEDKPDVVIGVFRGARFEKKIATDWWTAFVERLREKRKNLLVVDLLEPGIDSPLAAADVSISFPDLRELAGVLSCLNGFVSADTGPMHLASAARVPVLALFKTTDSSQYGPLGDRDMAILINGKEIESIVDAAASIFFPE